MEIVKHRAAFLSNYEVLLHIHRQKAELAAHDKRTKSTIRVYENQRTVEFEVAQYLRTTPARHQSEQQLLAFRKTFGTGSKVPVATTSVAEDGTVIPVDPSKLESYGLVKTELLQLVNLVPRQEIGLFLIIEECGERYNEEQRQELLRAIELIFPQPPEEQQQQQAEQQEKEQKETEQTEEVQVEEMDSTSVGDSQFIPDGMEHEDDTYDGLEDEDDLWIPPVMPDDDM